MASTRALAEAITEEVRKGRSVKETIETVKVDELNIDPSYQRPLSMDLVQQIAATWDEEAAGPIVVSKRKDGSLWVVNGQHRTAAAQMAGKATLTAQVIHGLTPEEEAALRIRTNVRLVDRPIDRFRAQLAMNERSSQEIVEILEHYDTHLNLSAPDAFHGLNSVVAIERIYDKSPDLLKDTLSVVKSAFKRVEGKTGKAEILRGVAWFLDKHGHEADVKRLITRMKDEGALAVENRMKVIQASVGGAGWMNYYRALVELYNQDLSKRERLSWETRKGGGYYAEEGE